jgi:hypothetical protein
MIINEDDYLAHYGTPRHSGRYPWGSGEEENTRNKTLSQEVSYLKKQGLKEADIATGLGYKSTTDLRAAISRTKNAQRQSDITQVQRLRDDGYSPSAIAVRTGLPGSTVRSYLAPGAADKVDVLTSTANMLRDQVNEKGFVDVGKGVAISKGISTNKFDTALSILEQEGYPTHSVSLPQVTAPHDTKMKVLGLPGSTKKDIYQDPTKVKLITDSSEDGGRNWNKTRDPLSIDSKRVGVLYKGEGGELADGVIYVRPGVKDVELGGKNYAQVRVMVDNTHFVKGMAMYKTDLPPGVDLVFNTSKERTGSKLDALKPREEDIDLPFGSLISRQIGENLDSPHGKVTSVMNIVNEEGKWDEWSKTLSSQMLSKQSPILAKSQLDMTYEHRLNDFEQIKALTNATVRKKMLKDFADNTDSAAVHLKAAAMPGQQVRVILPIASLKKTEVYAPTFKHGEEVVLIRFPHSGPFEIPTVTVNNNHAESKRLLGKARDAIGINHDVAKQLSGADFDGDTVLVIPNYHGRIKTASMLEDLKDFDPRSAYPKNDGMQVMSKNRTQSEMGKISNLITDMSIANASHDEIARAVKHSMVVIDAAKHELDFKRSENDNNIKQLKDKYQRQVSGTGGASTLISRRKSEERVADRKPRPHKLGGPINKQTGELEFIPTGRINRKTGKEITIPSTKLTEAKDAHTLSSGTPMERYYADHSNKLKSLANQARLEMIRTPTSKRSPSARETYKDEVASLQSKLATAQSNAPLERQANLLANSTIRTKRNDNPNMDSETLKKVKTQALNEARNRTGADKKDIEITQKEWDAIQAGAISDSKLTEILNHAKPKIVRDLATPKDELLMTPTVTARAKTMLASGFSRDEVAQALGVSKSTLDLGVKE